jgi:hypothetical protein
MGNIRIILEPDFKYITSSTQKYQVLAVIFRYYFYGCTRYIFEFYAEQKFYHLAHKYCNIRFYRCAFLTFKVFLTFLSLTVGL